MKIRACERYELDRKVVKPVELAPGADGKPREGLVLLGDDGTPRAYLNRCRHLPVPIDGGSRDFLTEDGLYLLCNTHGALYHRDDGMCVSGPCEDQALEALALSEEDGVLYIED